MVMALEAHPAADLFPLMVGEEFESFKADIAKNGQKVAIVTYKGQVLDGRNRHRACTELNIDPKTWEYPGDNPLGYVISMNLLRRHLDESQRSMVAAKLANMKLGDN